MHARVNTRTRANKHLIRILTYGRWTKWKGLQCTETTPLKVYKAFDFFLPMFFPTISKRFQAEFSYYCFHVVHPHCTGIVMLLDFFLNSSSHCCFPRILIHYVLNESMSFSEKHEKPFTKLIKFSPITSGFIKFSGLIYLVRCL